MALLPNRPSIGDSENWTRKFLHGLGGNLHVGEQTLRIINLALVIAVQLQSSLSADAAPKHADAELTSGLDFTVDNERSAL